jgi:hypothetical protein
MNVVDFLVAHIVGRDEIKYQIREDDRDEHAQKVQNQHFAPKPDVVQAEAQERAPPIRII